MTELLKKKVLVINYNNSKPFINLTISNDIPKIIYDEKMLSILNKYKDYINNVSHMRIWDFCKKLSNQYELLHHYIKNKNSNLGIANYDPISRSFFKFWELVYDFDLIDNTKDRIVYGAIAEGPGGFIESFNFYRRKYSSSCNDIINCITLKSDSDEIPGWKNSNKLLRECKNFNICWGNDGTGNIYNTENIKEYAKLFINQKADLVTSDGGFDFSRDYSNQEINAVRLIISEIVTAFSILKVNGHFLIKVYDIFHNITIDIIYLLTMYFENINIVKPHTSRTANSEKYIICKFFKGIHKSDLDNLINVLNEFVILNEQNKYPTRLLSNKIPTEFIDLIFDINTYHLSKQIKSIISALILCNIKLSNTDVNSIKNEQTIYSLSWCDKYDFPVNSKCRYLKKYNQYNYIPNY